MGGAVEREEGCSAGGREGRVRESNREEKEQEGR